MTVLQGLAIAYTLFGTFREQQAQRQSVKQRVLRTNALLDSRAIDVKLTSAGQIIPKIYGIHYAPGLPSFYDTQDNFGVPTVMYVSFFKGFRTVYDNDGTNPNDPPMAVETVRANQRAFPVGNDAFDVGTTYYQVGSGIGYRVTSLSAVKTISYQQNYRTITRRWGFTLPYRYRIVTFHKTVLDVDGEGWTSSPTVFKRGLGEIPEADKRGVAGRNQFLMGQYSIGLGSLNVIDMDIDSTRHDDKKFNNVYNATFYAPTNNFANGTSLNEVNDIARFQSDKRVSKRVNGVDTYPWFHGITYCTGIFKKSLTPLASPTYFAQPNVSFYTEGDYIAELNNSRTTMTRTNYARTSEICSVLYNLMTNRFHHKAFIDPSKIDYENFLEEAALNRSTYSPIGDGRFYGSDTQAGTQITKIPLWAFNGSIPTDLTLGEQFHRVIGDIPGIKLFANAGGKWRINIPKSTPGTPIILTDNDIMQSTANITYPPNRDKLNEYTVKFSNVNKDFAEDSITFEDAPGLISDQGIQLSEEKFHPGIKHPLHAYNTARWKVIEERAPIFSAQLIPKWIVLEPGDIVRVMSNFLELDMIFRLDTTLPAPNGLSQVTGIKYDYRDWVGIINRGDQ